MRDSDGFREMFHVSQDGLTLHIRDYQPADPASGNWLPLDPNRTYKLFVLSFNATGGDGYKTLANVPAARRQDIGVLDADVLQAYIDKQAKDPVSGLPVLNLLPISLYSTKTYSE